MMKDERDILLCAKDLDSMTWYLFLSLGENFPRKVFLTYLLWRYSKPSQSIISLLVNLFCRLKVYHLDFNQDGN